MTHFSSIVAKCLVFVYQPVIWFPLSNICCQVFSYPMVVATLLQTLASIRLRATEFSPKAVVATSPKFLSILTPIHVLFYMP